MKHSSREASTDAMQEIYEGTLAETNHAPLPSVSLDPLSQINEKLKSYESLYIEQFLHVDWQQIESRLDTCDVDASDGDNDFSALVYTESLYLAAFEDSNNLLRRAIQSLPRDVQANYPQVADTLHRSKKNILQISQLADYSRQSILLETTQTMQYDGSTIRWNDEIQSQIDKYKYSQDRERGCPAHHRIITQNGKKTTLLYAFWDSLIDYVFLSG